MGKRNKNYTTKHHRIPRSKAYEGLNVNEPINIIPLIERVHKGLHDLFENRTPKKQLKEWNTQESKY